MERLSGEFPPMGNGLAEYLNIRESDWRKPWRVHDQLGIKKRESAVRSKEHFPARAFPHGAVQRELIARQTVKLPVAGSNRCTPVQAELSQRCPLESSTIERYVLGFAGGA